MIKNKKGAVGPLWWGLAMMLLVLIVLFVLGKLPVSLGSIISNTGKLGERLTDLDCDKDLARGVTDACPCWSKGDSPSRESGFFGCPSGTSSAARDDDATTCFQYITDDADRYTDKCEFDDKKKCQTRCEQIRGNSLELPSSAGKGAKGNWDIQAEVIRVLDGTNLKATSTPGNDGTATFNLGNTKEKATLSLQYELTNSGSQKAPAFQISYEVCDKQKSNCREKSSQTINSFDRKHNSEIHELIIGEGDHCDGPDSTSCYLKLKLDSQNDLDEKIEGERNNEIWVLISLENQFFQQIIFNQYQIAVIVDDSNTPGGSVGGPVDWFCSGCDVAQAKAKYIDDFGTTDGELPDGNPDQPGSCWVFGSNEDVGDDNVGAVAMPEGTIINFRKAQKFVTTLQDFRGSHADGVSAVKDFSWKGDRGAYLCRNSFWQLCTASKAGQKSIINKKQFTCNSNLEWT